MRRIEEEELFSRPQYLPYLSLYASLSYTGTACPHTGIAYPHTGLASQHRVI